MASSAEMELIDRVDLIFLTSVQYESIKEKNLSIMDTLGSLEIEELVLNFLYVTEMNI